MSKHFEQRGRRWALSAPIHSHDLCVSGQTRRKGEKAGEGDEDAGGGRGGGGGEKKREGWESGRLD